MSRWVLRAAIFFCCLALLSATALLLFKLELAERSVLVTLLWSTTAAFLAFALLLVAGTWWKWQKQQRQRKQRKQL
jgi:membrane protein implicated in regulation of membrane protease activity